VFIGVLVGLGGCGGLTGPAVLRGRRGASRVGGGVWVVWRRAGWSLRLPLRSGLRQSGRVFDLAVSLGLRVLRGRREASRGCRLEGMGGVEEGRSVAPPAAALRPSAERKGLRPDCFPGPAAQAVMGAGLWPLDWCLGGIGWWRWAIQAFGRVEPTRSQVRVRMGHPATAYIVPWAHSQTLGNVVAASHFFPTNT
jgi:hypothetical protein